MTEKTLYNMEQVQEQLGVGMRTVLRFLESGDLTGIKVGREWRFTQEDIDRFLDIRRKKTEQEMQAKRQKKSKPAA